MSALNDFFKFKSFLENSNPYMTEEVFYSKDEDVFILSPLKEDW